jgi:hypothetical protein
MGQSEGADDIQGVIRVGDDKVGDWQQYSFLARNVVVVDSDDKDDGEQVVTGEFLLAELKHTLGQLRPKPPRP